MLNKRMGGDQLFFEVVEIRDEQYVFDKWNDQNTEDSPACNKG